MARTTSRMLAGAFGINRSRASAVCASDGHAGNPVTHSTVTGTGVETVDALELLPVVPVTVNV